MTHCLIDRPTDLSAHFLLTDRLNDWPVDWLTDLLTYLLTDWWTNWLTDWLTCWLTLSLTDWLIDQLTYSQTDSMTDLLTDWLMYWLTDWLTHWLIDWHFNWLIDWLAYQLPGQLTRWLAYYKLPTDCVTDYKLIDRQSQADRLAGQLIDSLTHWLGWCTEIHPTKWCDNDVNQDYWLLMKMVIFHFRSDVSSRCVKTSTARS